MRDYHGSHNGNRFIVFDRYDRGTCVCGKEGIELIDVKFDSPVTVRTYNNKTTSGTQFGFGSECINSFTVDSVNPIIAAKDAAYIRNQQQKHDFFSVVNSVRKP